MRINILNNNTLKGGFKSVLGQVNSNKFDGRHVIVVPDKFSLNAERLVMEELGLNSTLNIEITTLARLADTYSKKVQLPTLSKNAGIMVIQSVVLGMDNLQCFGGARGFTGFCENVFNTIMQLKSCNITPTKLSMGIEKLDNLSAKKIQDLVAIYEKYESFCHERFLDSANKLDILASEVENDYTLNDTYFYFCMSENWTEQAMNAVQNLIRSAKAVYFAVVDFDTKLPLKTSNQIKEVSNNLNIQPSVINTQDILPIEFDAINSLLLNCRGDEKIINNFCSFFNANDVREEIERVAKKINLCVRAGARFKDFGVACANLLDFQTLITDVFAEYKIPCFFDCEKPIQEMPLIVYLNSIFDMLLNFNKQTIFSVMHNRFFMADFGELCKFENFVLKLGFDRQQFLNPFAIYNAKYYSQEDLNLFEKLRLQIQKFYQTLLGNFTKEIKISEFCESIKKLLKDFNLEEENTLLSIELESNGYIYESAMNEQVLDKLNNLLNEMEMIFGGTVMPLQDVLKIFKSGLDSITLSNAPLKLDNVIVGDSNNSILVETENIFFINCVEGVFPKILNDCGLISDAEIDKINWAKIEPSIRQINFVNKFNLIQNIFMAKNKIEFSYSINNQLKQLQNCSNFLTNILNLFCDTKGKKCEFSLCTTPLMVMENNGELSKFLSLMGSEISARRYVLNALWRDNKNIDIQKNIAILYDFFAKSGVFSLKIENKMELLDNLLKLSIKNKTSVSQIGSYFDCPFKHFGEYALQLKERELADIESMDIGNFLHAIAEQLGKRIKESGIVTAENNIGDIIKSVSNDVNFKYKFERLSKSLKVSLYKEAERMCQAIIYQLKNSEFKIDEVEYEITYNIGEENPLNVYGKVDRLDCYGDYFRIIDYKTGSKHDMNLDKIYFGNRLQMLIYANAVSKAKNKIKCGMYYMHVKDKYSAEGGDEFKDYRLSGLTLDDAELVLAQDRNLCLESPKSTLLDVSISKKNSKGDDIAFNGAGKTVLSSRELSLLSNYCEKLMLQVRDELGQGFIQCSPRDKKVCEYCKYHTLCEFDQMRGNGFRDIKVDVKCVPILKEKSKMEVVENECE